MNRYVLQRLALVIPTVTGVSLIIFALMRLLPGDVVDILFGGDTQLISGLSIRFVRIWVSIVLW
jgi:hypothetical protein